MFLIGVNSLKGQTLTRLARGRTIRFSASLEPIYFDRWRANAAWCDMFAASLPADLSASPARVRRRWTGWSMAWPLASLSPNLNRREAELASVAAIAPEVPAYGALKMEGSLIPNTWRCFEEKIFLMINRLAKN
jgi:hypothetical protein